ncbi:hypothetical protein AAW51_2749 [Caldimonas brevitalea]|uniref:Uncharacterized protein n=1 Tax=Caldimonas brevitalea TaxID=413882 RepID=A0A0G3BSB1_9BURK|nr:hypothetical protein AAW51_2749 [Caldimonas brevitalea]
MKLNPTWRRVLHVLIVLYVLAYACLLLYGFWQMHVEPL